MPIFRNRTIIETMHSIKVLLSLEVLVTRGQVPESHPATPTAADSQARKELEQVRQRLRSNEEELARLRAELERASGGDQVNGVKPENIIWLFGSQRTGSTWLSAMMAEMKGHAVWDEPLVGMLFGDFHRRTADGHAEKRARHYIFGDYRRESWLASIQRFVLAEASVRFPDAQSLTIKEPNGSIGAPLLVEAMPESALIFLVRDPRDAVASSLAAHKKGGWLYKWSGEARRNRWSGTPDENPDAFVHGRARFYAANIGSAKEAYGTHQGRKILVRYEDLRMDTLGTMKRIYSTLEVDVNQHELARAVQKHSWERIPEERKGEDKFYRKAKPGSWREDLTPQQVEIVQKVTAPLLKEFYPG